MDSSVAPVIRSVTVAVAPEEAFAAFTERMGEWWPLEIHGIFGGDAVDVVLEPRVGGRVYEVSTGGEEALWAEILEYDPPRRFALAWRPNPDRPAPTHVEVSFSADGTGTRVELVHTGWERLGDLAIAQEVRDSYDSGWPVTLRRFAEVATTKS
ncbi:MAG TPA: SRPBCC family protein [Actinomycetota bacterium]|nr:SRPBCC family protein [Actinomycetota bacterium]